MNVLTIVKYVFAFIGIGLLTAAGWWYLETRSFIRAAVRTKGTVVRLDRYRSRGSTTYHPVVSFTDRNGEQIEFVSSAGGSVINYSRNERVEVLYLPHQPEQAKLNSFSDLWGGPSMMGGMGILFFAVGAGIFLAGMLRARREQYLRRFGVPLQTEFIEVEINRSVWESYRGHPFCVVTRWESPHTPEILYFRSGDLWFDPSNYLRNQPITVFVDRKNHERYYVDLSFLQPES